MVCDRNLANRPGMIGDIVNRNLILDAENHLTGVSGGTTATFVYDGDCKRVKARNLPAQSPGRS